MTAARSKRILFLFSDTGGGHRSATEAIIEAMELEFPGVFETSMIDFFVDYYPRPLNHAPQIYPPLARVPQAWRLSYKASDSRGRSNAINGLSYPYLRRAAKRLVAENPADLIVSVHPLVNTTLARSMRRAPRPFITVVTDLVTTHAFWYDRRADLVVVATEAAKQRGIHFGIPEGNLRVIGLPVADRFCRPTGDPVEFRRRMGWREDLPVVLLASGGDGLGPVKRVAKALNDAALPATLVVICGRNAELKAELAAMDWRMPVHLYGFTSEMPAFMAASDMLLTKAGPGTISEAFISGLPLVLYARLPGQEDGNVSYVVQEKAGIWAPRPREVIDAVRHWIEVPEARQQAAEASRRMARPEAARQIARLVADQVGVLP